MRKPLVLLACGALVAAPPMPAQDVNAFPAPTAAPLADNGKPAELGVSKSTVNGVAPKAVSFDRQWTVNGFKLLDRNGNVAFHWREDAGIKWRESLTVSWSPDSCHVIVLQQFGRAPMYFAAELVNGQWTNVLPSAEWRDTQRPAGSRVEKVELLNWVSSTAIQVKARYLVDAFDHNSVQWISNVETLQFANGRLRLTD